ncbi:MAG: hypothetical protein WC750_03290 [Patescibacteria group bacterium]|jgi:hypothetical protein
MSKNSRKFFSGNFSEARAEVVRRDREVEQSLRTIYAGEEGMPDMTRFEKIKSHGWIVALIGIPFFIILLCAAAWAGFWAFKSFNGFSDKGLVLSIEGPSQVTLGEETTYYINYLNSLKEPMVETELRVNFPADFIMTETQPQIADKQMVWKIGSLAAEEKGTITVKGRFTGALGTLSAIQAVATCRPASRSNNLEVLATEQITYAATILEGSITVPEKAIPGNHMDLIYHLINKGVDALSDLEARVTLPEGFAADSVTTSQDVLKDRLYSRKITTLSAGSSTEIIISGVFASGFGGQAKVTAEAGTLAADGTFMPAQKAEASFPVLAGDLNLKLVVNGSDASERSVGYGENLQCTIGYENTANEPLKNVTLRLLLESENSTSTAQKMILIDWDKLKSAASGTRQDQSLVWNEAGRSELKEIAPRGDGSIEISIPLTGQATGTGMSLVRATVFADIGQMGNSKVNRTIQIAPMVFKLKSDAKLAAEARYYSEEGAPLGSGPIPPKVGEATRYRIFWTVNKNVHGLKDMEVSAVLPRNVRFANLVTSTAGELAYDATARRVAWRLNRLPEDVGSVSMEFDVELTPVASDDGKFVDLIGDANFQAVDENIKENIMQVIKAINTDLQNDESAKGKGVVRK